MNRTPKVGHNLWGIFMTKLTKQTKLKIYSLHQKGATSLSLSKRFNIGKSYIRYLIDLIDLHGLEIVEMTDRRAYTVGFKLMLIKKVLEEHRSILELSLKYALPNRGTLANWVRQYRANNGMIINQPNKRKSTMIKPTKPYEQMTEAEKIAFLEEQNELLVIENKYLKKLKALTQQAEIKIKTPKKHK